MKISPLWEPTQQLNTRAIILLSQCARKVLFCTCHANKYELLTKCEVNHINKYGLLTKHEVNHNLIDLALGQ